MSHYPDTWLTATGFDVFQFVTSGSRGWARHYAESGSAFIRVGNLKHGTITLNLRKVQRVTPPAGAEGERTRLKPNDLLISITAEIGMVALVPEGMGDAYINQHIALARPKHGNNSRFLAWYLASDADGKRYLRDLSRGGTKTGLGLDDIRGIEVPLPPILEQNRIADKLDKLLARVDACRDRLDRLPSLIDRLRQSALTGAIQGSLTADWRAANGSAVAGIEAEADELAVRSVPGWTYVRADAACSKVQSGGTPKEGFIAAGGAPFLKVYNLVGQQVDFAYRPQFIADNIHRGSMRKSITLPGDVLMNIVGPPLGKVAVVPADFPQWNINQAITLFRAGPKVLSEWLYFVLCEGSAVRQVMPDTRGSVGQVNISLSQCRAFVLPVPPIDEQREAVRRLQKLFVFAQQLSDRLRNAEAAVNRLTPAVLAKAFRGELVAQDPADEPGGVMLQRLRTGVALEASAKRRRRPATA